MSLLTTTPGGPYFESTSRSASRWTSTGARIWCPALAAGTSTEPGSRTVKSKTSGLAAARRR